MTVRKIIEESAELLGVELTEENTENLLRSYNLIENELAIDYFPLRTVDKLLIKDNKIKYTELKNMPYRILKILDYQNDEVKYHIYTEYIELKKNYNGAYFFVIYNYIPKEKSVDDNCEYDERYKQVLKYGVCSEYCVQVGCFETASIFSEEYKRHIKEIYFYKRIGKNNGEIV